MGFPPCSCDMMQDHVPKYSDLAQKIQIVLSWRMPELILAFKVDLNFWRICQSHRGRRGPCRLRERSSSPRGHFIASTCKWQHRQLSSELCAAGRAATFNCLIVRVSQRLLLNTTGGEVSNGEEVQGLFKIDCFDVFTYLWLSMYHFVLKSLSFWSFLSMYSNCFSVSVSLSLSRPCSLFLPCDCFLSICLLPCLAVHPFDCQFVYFFFSPFCVWKQAGNQIAKRKTNCFWLKTFFWQCHSP